MKIEEIHDSIVNGQKQQMVKQIDEYGLYDFWADYYDYLGDIYNLSDSSTYYFRDAVISYHRITNR